MSKWLATLSVVTTFEGHLAVGQTHNAWHIITTECSIEAFFLFNGDKVARVIFKSGQKNK